MTFMSYVLLFLWLPASLTALIFFIRPSRRWPIFGTRLRSFLLLISFFFGMPVLGAMVSPAMGVQSGPGSSSAPAASTPAQAAKDDAALDAKRYLELSGAKTARSKKGTVLLSGKVFNGGEQPVTNPSFKCYLSKGGQDAGVVSGVLSKTIPASKEVAFAALDMGKASGAWNHEVCEIASAETAKP